MTIKSTAAYTDVMPIMDQAAQTTEGLRYRLSTYGAAVNFRQRCYRYRKLLRELAAERIGDIPGMAPGIPEDGLILRIFSLGGMNYSSSAPPEAQKGLPFDVYITHREVTAGELLTIEGNPLRLDEPEIAQDLFDDEEGLALE